MSDDISISYSYQTDGQSSPAPTQAAPAREMDAALYAFDYCDRIDLDPGSALLLNRRNGKQITISPEVATALTYCGTFKTLQEHARTLVNSIPQLQGQLDDVTRVLHMVRDAGLMLAAEEVCAQLKARDQPRPELAPTRVCIITCDRPASLERLLDSMLRAGNLSGNDALFLVDDSRDNGNRDQNRELVAKFNLTSPRDMHYVGADAQQQMVGEMVSALPQHDAAIRFLADRERWTGRKTYGLARTFCLLLSVGYRCVILDDDILCNTVSPPLRADGVSFGGGDGRELACFASEAELMQNAVSAGTDPITGHTQCLGMELGQALEALDISALQPTALAHTNAALLNTLHQTSPVLVTQCGSWGDPGTAGSNWLFHLDQDSIERALAVPGGLSSALQNRHYWLGRSRPNIAKMAVMSQATGLDNSRLLPPYFPAYRSEDYLFAAMVVCLHPDSVALDYAWSVPHLPVEQRGSRGAREPVAASAGLGLCARYLSDWANFEQGACAATRLQSLAAHIQELGERQPASLLATFRKELATQHAEQLKLLQRQVQSELAQGSAAWEAYLQRGIEEVSRELQTPADPMNIPEVNKDQSAEAVLAQLQSAAAEFGNALAAWPSIRAEAESVTDNMLKSGALTP